MWSGRRGISFRAMRDGGEVEDLFHALWSSSWFGLKVNKWWLLWRPRNRGVAAQSGFPRGGTSVVELVW